MTALSSTNEAQNISHIFLNIPIQQFDSPKLFKHLSLSLFASTLLWLVHIQWGKSIGDNGFNSLTLHLPQCRAVHWGGKSPRFFYAFRLQYSSEVCTLCQFCIWPLLGCNPTLVLHRSRCCYAFITSAPALNLWEQTAVYCSGGDWVKISNRLIPPRDNSTNITVIHQKKCLMSRVLPPLSIFHFGHKK